MEGIRMKQQMLDYFAKAYGDNEGVQVFFAPGRVNMIGEHTDYSGGYVFPAAISASTTIAVRKRSDRTVRIKATDLPDVVTLDMDKIGDYKDLHYGNYQAGIIDEMMKDGKFLETAKKWELENSVIIK